MFREQISLHSVTHTFRRDSDDGVFQLGPIDLELRSGEVVFLAGGNGSGKTTLAKLLVGLYRPESGEIRVDREPVTEAMRPAYREMFSAVFSDFHLFESTLGLDPKRVEEHAPGLLAELRIAHKVSIERGHFSSLRLSQGQRKRLALLVALLEDRSIYVFDEWAADQDPAYKALFYREWLPKFRGHGKAVLVISHDDRYFELADRLIKLESGKIVSITGGVSSRPTPERGDEALRAPSHPWLAE